MSALEPLEDGAATAAGQFSGRSVQYLATALVFLAINGSVAFVVEVKEDVGGGLVLGAIFAQSTVLAVWSAWGTWTMFRRVAVSTVLVGIAGSALGCCIAKEGGNSSIEIMLFSAVILAQWLLVQLPLWLLRFGFGYRLWQASKVALAHVDELRFGLKHLLAWMTLVGVTLAATTSTAKSCAHR